MSEASALFASYGQNAGYVQELFELYRTDRSLVTTTWASIFDKHLGVDAPTFPSAPSTTNGKTNGFHATVTTGASLDLQERVFRLVRAFRERGHLKAKINPLSKGVRQSPVPRDLQIEHYGFSPQELQQEVACERFQGKTTIILAELLAKLDQVYCGAIGIEWSHLLDSEARDFVRERIEARPLRTAAVPVENQKRILKKLVDAEVMEFKLHKKYIGQKWFSLQGGETLIPTIDTLLNEATENGIHEAMICMAHRGRLNVLANTVGKPLADLFNEFEDKSHYSVMGSGDVKYHLGYTGTHHAPKGGTLRIGIAPNPSHLEFVNPVMEGICRARQDHLYNRERTSVLPIAIHGEAAFIGQGVVFETLNLVALSGYSTGGTVHFLINNQVGFTTNPDEYKSSAFCTDYAKGFEALVMHVNSEDPEACAWAAELAIKYRNRFQRDVIIDMYCYRKYGHNEADDPSFTQPSMYAEIAEKKSLSTIYGEFLVSSGAMTESEVRELHDEYERVFLAADTERPGVPGDACPMHGRLVALPPATSVSKEVLQKVAGTLVHYPENFAPHQKLVKILEKRVETLQVGKGIDWGFAEGLAFGSLLLEGKSVRLSGQDCGRGTFSQRQLVIANHEDGRRYIPFEQLSKEGGSKFDILNSSLSEAAVLGFEFGYASQMKEGLVIWEAQFGDFCNGAQVHIDQFISSCEAKWHQYSGIVMMLPHGYEGQGAEHSSARLERFLQLCAEGNMVVCYPTKASQHFHLLRRQALSEIQRPLVIMTPKSLLRHPGAGASIEELTFGGFERVISEELGNGPASSTTIFMTGKVYYDLSAVLAKEANKKARVIRVEEIYPFPKKEIAAAIKGLKDSKVLWVQEEPQNMGAWSYIAPLLKEATGQEPIYVGRPASACPAAGSGKAHAREQGQIVKDVLAAI